VSDGIWFPLYPERFLASRKVRRMDATDLGIYLALLMEEWIEGGALPDDDEELAIAGRAPIEDVRRILDLCFEATPDGWENHTLEEIRREQLQKHEHARRAGKKGAEVRWAKRKKHGAAKGTPKGGHSNPIATPMVPQCDPNSIREERRGEEKRGEEIGADAPELSTVEDVGSNGSMAANELLAYWLDQQRDPVPEAQKRKQGAAASRLCKTYTRDQLTQAAVGIAHLFPHNAKGGQPWDLFDLEKKFAKAMSAAHQHPDAKIHNDVAELTAYLENRHAD
jgi:uncharacterized protein YdaU (DUF1376 family)